MKKNEKTVSGKRSYEKPALRSIELAAEEVLAVGCKATGMASSGLPACHARPCANKGS